MRRKPRGNLLRTSAVPILTRRPVLPIIPLRYHSSEREPPKVDHRPVGDGRVLEDEYATIRESYETPKHPIVLAHGLLGFDEFKVINALPGVQYWRGIQEALKANGIEVFTTSVPPSGSIEARGYRLSEDILRKAGGKSVNIIAGLDARYMISCLKPAEVKVLSLTTIATPHRGSSFADFVFDQIGPSNVPRIYKAMESMGFETKAFSQLTRSYMQNEFNSKATDREGVRYYSYGSTVEPSLFSAFRQSHRIIEQYEGPNDGLVSVESSQWGTYKGTLAGVSHLDLINWTNRIRWMIWELAGNKRNFNAIAFYLSIADMLAKEGL